MCVFDRKSRLKMYSVTNDIKQTLTNLLIWEEGVWGVGLFGLKSYLKGRTKQLKLPFLFLMIVNWWSNHLFWHQLGLHMYHIYGSGVGKKRNKQSFRWSTLMLGSRNWKRISWRQRWKLRDRKSSLNLQHHCWCCMRGTFILKCAASCHLLSIDT